MAETDWAADGWNVRGLCHRRTADSAMRFTDRCRRITDVYTWPEVAGCIGRIRLGTKPAAGTGRAAPGLTPRGPERLHIPKDGRTDRSRNLSDPVTTLADGAGGGRIIAGVVSHHGAIPEPVKGR